MAGGRAPGVDLRLPFKVWADVGIAGWACRRCAGWCKPVSVEIWTKA